MEHDWVRGKCSFCGVAESEYEREEGAESYAYQFIHLYEPEKVFDMKFDVIIGNPPYQMSTANNSAQAKPLYHKFVEQSIKLNPRYMTMIIPARWYAGGWGLDEFRKKMLNDNNLSIIHDFPNTEDCFPGVNIRGGICYFLWERDRDDAQCTVFNHLNGAVDDVCTRPLLEDGANSFVRYNKAITILKKVLDCMDAKFIELVSSQKPFGLSTNYEGKPTKTSNETIKIYASKNRISYCAESTITQNRELMKSYKLIMGKASPGADEIPHSILSRPILGEPNSVCTESYITVGPFESENIAKNVASYIATKFFRFLVMLNKPSMDTLAKVYEFVPMQDFSKSWTDKELYDKYGITIEEQAFIDSLIKPMELED